MNLGTYRTAPELGPIISVRRVATRFGGTFSAGAIAILCLCAYPVLRTMRNQDLGYVLLPAFAVVLFVSGVSWAFRRAFSTVIACHEHGLAFHDRSGVRSVHWRDFESVRFVPRKDSALDHLEYGYVVRENGRELTLSDDYAERDLVGRSIDDALAEQRGPMLRKRLDEGREVRFGEVVVGARGITLGARAARWDDIVEVRRVRTVIDLHRADGKLALEIDLDDVPNPRSFVELIEHRLSARA